jgi:hypothetical protein
LVRRLSRTVQKRIKKGMQGAHPLMQYALARAVKKCPEKDEKRNARGTPIDRRRACQGRQGQFRKG